MKVVIGEDPKVLQFAGSKISEVTIAFNSRALIGRDEPLIIVTSLDATIRCHYKLYFKISTDRLYTPDSSKIELFVFLGQFRLYVSF